MSRSLITLIIIWLAFSAHAQITMAPAPSGKIQLTLPLEPSQYAILYRSKDLTNWQPAALTDQSNNAGLATLTDPSQPCDRGFYQVHTYATSDSHDIDKDGRSDLVEFAIAPCHAFNPADPIAFTNGSISISDGTTFDSLAHRDNFPGALNVQEVKFLITNIDTNPSLYFMNMNSFSYHYNFARETLGYFDHLPYYEGLSIFNNETYFSNTNRRNIAGTLIYHENYLSPAGLQGIYTIEFWPTDPVSYPLVKIAYDLIANCCPFIDHLAYHPPSETQRDLYQIEKAQFDNSFIDVIDTNDLFSNISYQPMNQRSSFGRLVLSTGTETFSARDIVIFRNLPNDLTHIAGIITEVPQTPLSHVNLKAQQNDTPNAYIKDASTHPDIAPFIGENIAYSVGPDGFTIRLASQIELDNYFESIRPTNTSYPARNLTQQQILPFSNLPFSFSDAYGGKATNLAELHSLFPNNAPDGYAIPFYYYDEFMKHNGFYAQAQALIDDPQFQSDPTYREAALKSFRSTIKKSSTLPNWMTTELTNLQNSFPIEVTPRLRSSANAEDSVDFNGAGLYDSYTHHHDEGHLSKSVKQVWASLWNYRAFEEREFYRIDHLSAAMGIAVHPNYSDEQANGVAVARNIFDPNWEGYYINVQVGEDLVTNPDDDSIPEEMLVANLLGEEEYEIQYIRSSNQITPPTRVLTKTQVLDLVAKMKTLNSRFKSLYNSLDPNFAMEIEFKITNTGILLIKQARPWVN